MFFNRKSLLAIAAMVDAYEIIAKPLSLSKQFDARTAAVMPDDAIQEVRERLRKALAKFDANGKHTANTKYYGAGKLYTWMRDERVKFRRDDEFEYVALDDYTATRVTIGDVLGVIEDDTDLTANQARSRYQVFRKIVLCAYCMWDQVLHLNLTEALEISKQYITRQPKIPARKALSVLLKLAKYKLEE